jgi:hypothetical protein
MTMAFRFVSMVRAVFVSPPLGLPIKALAFKSADGAQLILRLV